MPAPVLAVVAAVGAVCFLGGLMLIVIRRRSVPISLTERWMPFRPTVEVRSVADEAEEWLSRQQPKAG